MLNYIGLIPVSPQKFPRVNYEAAMTFVKWLTDPGKGQKIIRILARINMEPAFLPQFPGMAGSQRIKKLIIRSQIMKIGKVKIVLDYCFLSPS